MAIACSAPFPWAAPNKTTAHTKPAVSALRNRRAERTHGRTVAALTETGSIRSARTKFIIMEERDRGLRNTAPANLETRAQLGYGRRLVSPIPKFARACRTLRSELRNRRTLATL